MRGSRGAALLLVIWLLLLLAGVVVVFAFSARIESMQGSALRTRLAGQLAAEAGLEVAALRLADADPTRRWFPDGRANTFDYAGHKVHVRVLDESGKVDLNAADAALLAELMIALGVEELRARQLAGAIQDWRDTDDLLAIGGGAEDPDYAAAGLDYGAKDQPFNTVSELQQVLGMDADVYARLVPHVTVFTASPRPLRDFAQMPVLLALGMGQADAEAWIQARSAWQPGLPLPVSPEGGALAAAGSGTYSVASRAVRADGLAVEVTSTVRIGAAAGFGQLYAPLAWRVGEPD
ncbi:type II secretion system protein K [Arenimonas soli]|uniref:Type II secretion system protein K n=1 Tax=Arenimonas soli TaxID=2269504 RepID=A0ABQ1HNS0_9GAMM|nr:type II secretion system protein GspK [Arenimonas soli]GGA84615.1 type II secretion system protein K [Arenimonas soli]